MKVILYAKKPFWNLSDEDKKRICNGIGAKGAWYNRLIPKWIRDLFEKSGDIHDYDYETGQTQEDKELADRRFSQNNERIVKSMTNPIYKFIARRVAKTLYIAVDRGGNDAYWKNKIVDKSNSMKKEVEV